MLSGPEQLEWRDALFDAFTDVELTALLRYRLNDRIDRYIKIGTAWEAGIGDLVDAYSRRDREDLLIAMAIEARPRNAVLLRLASRQGATSVLERDNSLLEPNNLERLVQESNSFLDLERWLQAAGMLQVCVCRVEIPVQDGGTVFGTGFLIAADLVMTNWHVVRCIAAVEDNDASYPGPRATASNALCRFDYKVLRNGTTNLGTTVPFARDWRVLLSPNNPPGTDPQPNQLDCAIVRLQNPVGKMVVGATPGAPGDLRGWIRLTNSGTDPNFKPNSPLFIIQHPSAQPIKLALSTNALQSVNANRTRVRYLTNTEAGSSGSPCFDQNWNLIALHHAGDPNFEPGHRPEFNEGVPMNAIVTLLQERGLNLANG